jgi:predicted Zn-dependent protease
MAQAKLRGFLDAPQIVFTQYPPDDMSDFALYARSVAHFRAADLKNAIKEIDILIERQSANPYFHELKAQILFESGKGRESLPSSERALELKKDSALLETALARTLTDSTQTEDLERAVDLFKSALRREPNNGYAWYSLSQAYGRLNKEAYAKYAIAEQAYHTGDVLRARAFASRAQKDLPRSSPQWRRASDIIVIADSELAKSRSKRRRPKL